MRIKVGGFGRVAAVMGAALGVVVAGAVPSGAAIQVAGGGLRPALASRAAAGTSRPKLEFKATFRGSQLDTTVWGTCYPWSDVPSGCSNFGNREHQWYLPKQDRVHNGSLHLVAQRKRTIGTDRNGQRKVYHCRSGMVTTYPGFRFEYGRVKVVARLPYATGMWPALWLAASNEKYPPEIDLVEHWGAHNHTEVVFHPKGGNEIAKRVTTGNLSVGWHTFELRWSSSRIVWIIDGQTMLTVHRHIPHQKMYLIANLADYKAPTSSGICSATMLVRSVKVWNH